MPIVLVVTDDIWVENDVRAALSDKCTEFVVVSDGRQAAEVAVEHTADLAVIDLQVGSMGGMAVVRALRWAIDAGQLSIRTVLLLDRTADAFLARRAGADVAVVKPFTAQELRAAVAPSATV